MIALKAGDIFCTVNPMALGRAILFIERLWEEDNEASYSHAGIITGPGGSTIEALWSIRHDTLDKYAGKQIIIGRWKGMTPEANNRGLQAIDDDMGKIYPFWRLPLFIIPGAAKWISSGKFTVCSELTCKFLFGAGFDYIGRWQGQHPEDVADMIEKWRDIEIVYQGVWRAKQ